MQVETVPGSIYWKIPAGGGCQLMSVGGSIGKGGREKGENCERIKKERVKKKGNWGDKKINKNAK